MRSNTRVIVAATAATAIALCAGQAGAAFMSQFDALPAGTEANGMNGWKGWNNVASDAGVISSDIAYEGPNSLLIAGYTDAVQTFTGATAGQWSLSAKQYIPSGQTGLQYFIILNTYADNAMNNAGMWSTQLKFNLSSGKITDDFRSGSVNIAFNQWADLRVDIDLDANTVSHFYNDALVSTGSWTRNGVSALAIAAVDLYTANDNRAYYDNLSLVQVPAPTTPGAIAIALAAVAIPVRRRRPR